MDQLESALVLSLREPLHWQSALEASSSGSLTPVDPSAAFDAKTYQRRDRELQYRDLVVTSAVLETALAVADVWHYLPDNPLLEGPALSTLPLLASEITNTGTNLSTLRHVRNTSIPWDAARYADADLYGRDVLLYEVLARACAAVFTQPPIPQIDASNLLVSASGSTAWSLGEGIDRPADINEALPLDRDLFKRPDQMLADRDNLIAAYVSRMAQVLKNPFAYAQRLYVRVDGPTPADNREAEVYVLTSDDGTERVWKCEPALSDRNQFVYNTTSKKLQWFRDQTDEVHVPQLYALTIPGIDLGQTITTLPEVPEPKDAQFWRRKAGQIQPEGEQISDTESYLTRTDSDVSEGGVIQLEAASLTVPPSTLTVHLPGTLAAGPVRLSVLVQPNSEVEIIGAQNTSDTSGTLGGADFEIDVPSGSLAVKTYLVEGGDGIAYAGTVYGPSTTFSGIYGTTAYTQVNGGFPSTVRQYAIAFNLPLPTGAWQFEFDYSNISGTNTTGFGVKAVYNANGQSAVEVMQDTVPLPWTGDNGAVLTSRAVNLQVTNNDPFNLNFYWTYGDGQFHVRALRFNLLNVTAGSYEFYAMFTNGGSVVAASVTGIDKLVDLLRFDGTVTVETQNPSVDLYWATTPSLPLRVKQVQFQTVGTFDHTPAASRVQGWRQECLDRAAQSVQSNYAAAVRAYGTAVPTFRDSGSGWSEDAMESWMSFAEVANPRLREMESIASDGIVTDRQYRVVTGPVTYGTNAYAVGELFYGVEATGSVYSGGTVAQVGAFQKSRPGHVGRPALIPDGLYVDSSGSVRAYYDTPLSVPLVVACQPWMIDVGVYVGQENFWMPDYIGNITVFTPSTGTTPEPPLPPPYP